MPTFPGRIADAGYTADLGGSMATDFKQTYSIEAPVERVWAELTSWSPEPINIGQPSSASSSSMVATMRVPDGNSSAPKSPVVIATNANPAAVAACSSINASPT